MTVRFCRFCLCSMSCRATAARLSRRLVRRLVVRFQPNPTALS